MKIILCFPHLTVPSVRSAYASMPILAGYLHEKTGCPVVMKDVNVELANKLMELSLRKGIRRKSTFFRVVMDSVRQWVLDEKRGRLSESVPYLISEGLQLALKNHYGYCCYDGYSVNLKYDELDTIINAESDDPLLSLLSRDYFDEVIEDKHPIVGISVAYFTQFLPAVFLAKFIKKINPNAFIVMGGAVIRHISHKLHRAQKLFNIVQCFVEKEGEDVMVDLATALSEGKDWRTTRGIIFRDDNGKVVKNSSIVFDINKAGIPDYSILNNHNYQEPGLVYVRASIGCYYNKCAFCVLSLNKYQERNIDKVMDDISSLREKHSDLKAIEFVDNAIHCKRLEKIADGLIDRGIDVSWYASTRFDAAGFDESLCRKLKKSGCVSLNIGLESGCQRVNDLMNKGVKVDDAERMLENLAKHGVKCSLNTIIGFPGETEEEARQTIDFLNSNWWRIANAYISFFVLQYGSDVYVNPEKYGVDYIEQDTDCFLKSTHVFSARDRISGEKLMEIKALYKVSEWQINVKRICKLLAGVQRKMRKGVYSQRSWWP